MAHGKMKTLFGLYKKVGRDAFLEAATYYSDHVCDTVDATLDEMETRWYDSAHTMTEAEKMVEDNRNARYTALSNGIGHGKAVNSY